MADIDSNLPTKDSAGVGPTGGTVPAIATQVAGTDGTNLRALATDTTGRLVIAPLTNANVVKAQLQDGSGNSLSSSVFNSEYALKTATLDGPALDNLQRLRTSELNTVLSLTFTQSPQTLLMTNALTGASTIAQNTNTASLRLTNTTSSSDSAILQTKQYVQYTPGRSYLITVSGNLGAKKTNVRQRLGYFDANDGMFFEQTGTDFAVVIRTSTSGSPVDSRTVQASWNLDKLDGTGKSGVTLDTSKHNLYVIDFLWHGAGKVRFGVVVNGAVTYCHQYFAGNVNTAPFTRTASLPMRAELTNTGTAASGTTLDVVCLVAQRESIDDPTPTLTFCKSNGTTVISATATLKPLISIRPKATFSGITNRIPVFPTNMQVLAGAQSTLVQIILNPTLTGASWNSVDTNSCTESDVSSTALTGGTVIAQFYVSAGTSSFANPPVAGNSSFGEIVLALNIAGSTADILTVAVESLAGGTNTLGCISWEEFQ